jgi:hypothetical protein
MKLGQDFEIRTQETEVTKKFSLNTDYISYFNTLGYLLDGYVFQFPSGEVFASRLLAMGLGSERFQKTKTQNINDELFREDLEVGLYVGVLLVDKCGDIIVNVNMTKDDIISTFLSGYLIYSGFPGERKESQLYKEDNGEYLRVTGIYSTESRFGYCMMVQPRGEVDLTLRPVRSLKDPYGSKSEKSYDLIYERNPTFEPDEYRPLVKCTGPTPLLKVAPRLACNYRGGCDCAFCCATDAKLNPVSKPRTRRLNIAPEMNWKPVVA